jgi:oligopeptide transport system permease protein
MIRMIAARAASALLVVVCVATLGFLALKVAPGGPFDSERRVSPEVMRNIERAYHLDWPLWKQYGDYMLRLAQGDLGQSMKRTSRVTEIIAENFLRSLELGLAALGFAILAGVGLGVLAAARQNKLADHAAMAVALAGVSIPSFVLGPLLITVFSLRLGWLPAARWDGPASMILPGSARTTCAPRAPRGSRSAR